MLRYLINASLSYSSLAPSLTPSSGAGLQISHPARRQPAATQHSRPAIAYMRPGRAKGARGKVRC
ncbi:hypothetical protein HaLaN_09626 [Haematococcus lacustris]|uniref:Uncharacterized protein n=1 Tax=Haematococcus lacustris TaxID=44745 RepID=A0A699ZDV5_HAELA|nr:hypothetical protein HaLaN_09626 [Haematococcus lacustris]